MRFFILLLISSVFIYAEDIKVFLSQQRGESSYTVSDDNLGLKATLQFPLNFQTFSILYQYPFENFNIQFAASFAIKDNNAIGIDKDWKNNLLTVSSQSNNYLAHYHLYHFKISNPINQKLTLTNQFAYSYTDILWSNTLQHDFVKNSIKEVIGDTLNYEQKLYQYALGFNYHYPLYQQVHLTVEPAFVLAHIKTKDRHILREFYTQQSFYTLGYRINLNFVYDITPTSKVILSLGYEQLKKDDISMDYYNRLDQHYLSLPSSYHYNKKEFAIGYQLDF